MSKKLMMNNKIDDGTIVLCKDFSPNGQPFTLWENKMIDWDKYELYMNIDTSTCKVDVAENIFSIGLAITSWIGYNIHIYNRTSQQRFEINYIPEVNSGYRTYATPFKVGVHEIIINKHGLIVNGLETPSNENNYGYSATNSKILNSPVSIGSQEGATRSNAIYNLVCLRPYQERSL